MEGSRLLRDWLNRKGLNQTEGSKVTGIKPGMLSDYIAGKKQPGIDSALKLAKATRGAVPVKSWAREGAGA